MLVAALFAGSLRGVDSLLSVIIEKNKSFVTQIQHKLHPETTKM